jgi:hypothetical protein
MWTIDPALDRTLLADRRAHLGSPQHPKRRRPARQAARPAAPAAAPTAARARPHSAGVPSSLSPEHATAAAEPRDVDVREHVRAGRA